MVKLRWSKNIHDERDIPEQIVLGAMNAKYCILLVLASFLEENISFQDGQSGEYLFGSPGQKPESLNINCYNALKKNVSDNAEFVRAVMDGNLGTHSFKKFGTTHP
eukprot:49505-Ditylum_brightwellii.AAC.1